jgi:hypothetical protein
MYLELSDIHDINMSYFMIIHHAYNPKLTTYFDNHHPDYPHTQKIKSPSTYRLVAEHSEYVKNYDCIFYEIGWLASALETPIESVLSAEYIASIKNKNTLLLVDMSFEVNQDQIPQIYKNLIVRDNLPAEQIVLISTTLDYIDKIKEQAALYNKPLIRYEYFPYFIRFQQSCYKKDCREFNRGLDHNNSGLYYETTPKKFLYLNNTWKEHRIALICLLQHYGVLSDSFVSFSGKPLREGLYQRLVKARKPIPEWLEKEQTNTVQQNWETWVKYAQDEFVDISDQISSGRTIGNSLPLTLDIKEFPHHIGSLSQVRLIRYYKDTYFSVVTESGYKNNVESHLTEKAFKAITYKHPFVYCSHAYSLEKLRYMGYKTFDGIINEEYDKELNPSKRMLMIADEVKRLCSLNPEQLLQFKKDCLPIVEYNFNKFINEKSFIQTVL